MSVSRSSVCRSCGAEVVWAVSAKSGKRMPVDPVHSATGNLAFNDRGKVEYVDPAGDDPRPRYLSHYATCPDAADWRKAKS